MKSGRKKLRASGNDELQSERQKKRKKQSSKNEYLEEVLELKSTIENWDNLFSEEADESRMSDWLRITILGEPLLRKYAWAIPDKKALNVLAQFSPIVEMGAGKGYWSQLMKANGVDVVPYDIEPPEDCWTEVLRGDPSVLSSNRKLHMRTLFLCYPDEGSAMALACLQHMDLVRAGARGASADPSLRSIGDYVLHVGELIHTGCASGSPQAPWGRSSSPDFQVKLSEQYHLVLALPLMSFPFSRDFLTVWKRTRVISMAGVEMEGEVADSESGEDSLHEAQEDASGGEGVEGGIDEEEGDEDNDDDEDDDDGDCEDQWADVKCSERIFGKSVVVANDYNFLLQDVNRKDSDKD